MVRHAAVCRGSKARSREPSVVEKRIMQLIKRGRSECGADVSFEEPYFKALKGRKKRDEEVSTVGDYQSIEGYQAGEGTPKRQNPVRKFPTTLASFVLVFSTDNEWQRTLEGEIVKEPSYAKLNMQPILDKLRSADMIVRDVISLDNKKAYALVSVSEKRQRMVAEIMGQENQMRVRMRRLDDEGNEVKNDGAWAPFKNDLYPYYEKSSEGVLFSSCQQQYIMEYLMNERNPNAMGPQLMQREACLPGNSILMQLQADVRIEDYFNLHHEEKKKWLESNWAKVYMMKQPIEDIREYFGERMALFFVFFGYMTTMLWTLATVGIFMFVVEIIAFEESGSKDNPYFPLFGIYVALWSINFSVGWRVLQIVLQHEWDTVNWEPRFEERPDFLQNPRTYKRLSVKDKKEEFYADPLWRFLALVLSFIAVSALCFLCIFAAVIVFMAFGNDDTVVLRIICSSLHGIIILVFRYLSMQVFLFLNGFENWTTMQQYETAFMTKAYAFCFLNAFFPIIFVAFIANTAQPFDVDVSCGTTCMDYVNLLVLVIFIQNAIARYVHRYVKPRIFFRNEYDKKGKVASTTPEWVGDEPDDPDLDNDPILKQVVQQEKAKVMDEMFEIQEYIDKILELSYVMLFANATPLLALIALVNNIVDLRMTAKTVLNGFRRPLYACANDIGSCSVMIDITTIMSIIVNSAFVAFGNNALMYYFPTMNEYDRVVYCVVMEHILLFVKVLFDSWAKVPEDVLLKYHVRFYEKSRILEEFDNKDPEQDVAFFTSDEGPLYYHSAGATKK